MNKNSRDKISRKLSSKNNKTNQKKEQRINTVKLRVKKIVRQENENTPELPPTPRIVLKNRLLLETDSDTERYQLEKITPVHKNDSTFTSNAPISPQICKNDESKSLPMEAFHNNSMSRKKVVFQSDPSSNRQNSCDQKNTFDKPLDGIRKIALNVDDNSSNFDSSDS